MGLEITERCNLKCAHCLRGDAQNIDMSKEVIDAFLEHTQAIYDLGITGGEPTIYLKGMRYFLESAKRHNVLIASMQFSTNGIVRTQELIDVVKDYHEYIKGFLIPEQQDKPFIRIYVSKDDFHETDYEQAYKWYCDNLSDYAFIGYNTGGQFPVKMGRANKIDYALNPDKERKTKIQIKTKDNKTFCKYKNQIQLFHPNQVIIMCGISVSTDGFLYNSTNREWDNEDKDNKITSVFVDSAQDIVDAIEKWNVGKYFCIEPEVPVIKNNRKNAIFSALDNYSLKLSNIKESAPSQEYKDNFFIRQLQSGINNYGSSGIPSAVLQGLVIGANVFEVLKNPQLWDSDELTSEDVYANDILSQIKNKELTGTELIKMTEEATDIVGKEKYGEYWEQIKELPLTEEERELYHLELQNLDCCKKLCEICPENQKYERQLIDAEQKLQLYRYKVLHDNNRIKGISTDLASNEMNKIFKNIIEAIQLISNSMPKK